jgi:nitrogen regulatory protein PII-like uncharacterized protein
MTSSLELRVERENCSDKFYNLFYREGISGLNSAWSYYLGLSPRKQRNLRKTRKFEDYLFYCERVFPSGTIASVDKMDLIEKVNAHLSRTKDLKKIKLVFKV